MLPFLRRNSPAAEQAGRQKEPPKDGLLPVESADALLQSPHRKALLRQITGLLALPSECAERYVTAALRRYAAFVQDVPASEVHHHSGRGGMLDHGLEVALKALQIRRGYVLPPGAEPERLSHEADAWSYGVFSAALLHDVGKPVVDQEIALYDAVGNRLGHWTPWYGPMTERPGARWYSVRYRRGRAHKLHEPVSSLVAHWILPPEGMSWIGQHQELLQSWIHAIHGHMEDAGALGQIILQADRESVARNLGGEPPDRLPTPTKPLHEKLMTSLRHLLSSEDLPLNRNGAAGWRTESDLWLVSKRAADALRAQLREEGHSGIPSNNDRIFDTLQEHGLLVANGDRAIWRARVAGDGWSHKLTLIRLPVARLWSDPETIPTEFEGSVTPLGEAPIQETTESAGGVASRPAPEEVATPAADPPAARTVAIQTGQPDEVAEDHSPSGPPVSAGVDDLPLPPGLDGALDKTTDEPTAEPPPQSVASSDSGADTPLPEDPGDACLEWIRRGVADGSLLVNTREARIHVVPEGVLLVSPGLFRDFASATGHAWNAAQKRFQRLQLHEKSSEGTNIHRYVVRGVRQTSRINGLLIRDTSVVFGPDWIPSPNDHLTPAAEA